jgi:hypothetical protein
MNQHQPGAGTQTAPTPPQDAAPAAPAYDAGPGREAMTLSTGVVLSLGRVSAWAITALAKKHNATTPQPPLVRNPDMDRDEPNEHDPAYRAALDEHGIDWLEMVYELGLATATRILHIPSDIPRPEDAEWRDALDVVGVPLSDDPRRRVMDWIKYVAAPGNEEWNELRRRLLRQVGTTEADVADAAGTFRGDPPRGTDPVSGDSEWRPDGDSL